MTESLVLFDGTVNSAWFTRTSIILFLNKKDIFKKKLDKSPMSNYFTEYTGGSDPNEAAKYVLKQFKRLNNRGLLLYPQ